MCVPRGFLLVVCSSRTCSTIWSTCPQGPPSCTIFIVTTRVYRHENLHVKISYKSDQPLLKYNNLKLWMPPSLLRHKRTWQVPFLNSKFWTDQRVEILARMKIYSTENLQLLFFFKSVTENEKQILIKNSNPGIQFPRSWLRCFFLLRDSRTVSVFLQSLPDVLISASDSHTNIL